MIEVDGSVHNEAEVIRNDAFRQKMIEQDNMDVLRFQNEEIESHINKVIGSIEEYINHREHHL